MSLPRTYRGWSINYDPKPIPVRNCDWTATHPDYDASYEGPEDGWVGSHPVLTAATEKDLMVEIDCWEEDNEASLRAFSVEFGNPRKEVQVCYEVQARTFADATLIGKRKAQLDRIPQAFHAVYEVAR